MVRRKVLVAGAALAIAVSTANCGGATASPPTAPTPANIAGSWTGTISFTTSKGHSNQVFNMSMVHEVSGMVSGIWQASDSNFDEHGGVNGSTTPTSFSGVFAMTIKDLNAGTQCNTSAAVLGPAGGTAMTWTSDGFIGGCSDPPKNVTVSVTKQ